MRKTLNQVLIGLAVATTSALVLLPLANGTMEPSKFPMAVLGISLLLIGALATSSRR